MWGAGGKSFRRGWQERLWEKASSSWLVKDSTKELFVSGLEDSTTRKSPFTTLVLSPTPFMWFVLKKLKQQKLSLFQIKAPMADQCNDSPKVQLWKLMFDGLTKKAWLRNYEQEHGFLKGSCITTMPIQHRWWFMKVRALKLLAWLSGGCKVSFSVIITDPVNLGESCKFQEFPEPCELFPFLFWTSKSEESYKIVLIYDIEK